MMSRKTRTILALAIVAGLVGYRQLKPDARNDADANGAKAASVAVAPA